LEDPYFFATSSNAACAFWNFSAGVAYTVPDGGGAPSGSSVLTGASKMTRASPRASSDAALRCDCHRKRPPATTATATTTRATILTSSPCARVQTAACSIPERNSSS
jgi:hypothetical protein